MRSVPQAGATPTRAWSAWSAQTELREVIHAFAAHRVSSIIITEGRQRQVRRNRKPIIGPLQAASTPRILRGYIGTMPSSYPPLLDAWYLTGPTASGKSALALSLAERRNGTVINADAMQTYDALPILTAQPTHEERRLVPHALYGVLPLAETLKPDPSAARSGWMRPAAPLE